MSAESQMSAEPQGLRDRIGSWRRSFRVWRGERPYWAGLLTLLGGLPIMYLPYANLTLGQLTIRMATTAGSGSLIIGVLLVVLGFTMWFQHAARVFAGVAAILLALVSLVVSNFGGFLVGFLLALIGGGLAIAWAPAAAAPDGGEPAKPSGPAGGTGGGEQRAPQPVTSASSGLDFDAFDAFNRESQNGRHRA